MSTPASDQFKKMQDHGRIAFEGFMAVYRNGGNHILLVAPSLDSLSDAWDKIVEIPPLVRESAQHVLIVKAGAEPRAQEEER